jgi:hypothetical protein
VVDSIEVGKGLGGFVPDMLVVTMILMRLKVAWAPLGPMVVDLVAIGRERRIQENSPRAT